MAENIIFPQSLHPGDKISIVAPATIVKGEYIDGAAERLRAEGFEPVVMPAAKGPASGTYAASQADRLKDLADALGNPDISAVLCARGGYGCVHLIPEFDPAFLRENAKWLIGFSDVSALHAMMLRAGVASIHGPMAKHLATEEPDHYCSQALFRLMREGLPSEYYAPAHPLNIAGEGSGMLVGGNLAVLNGLAATPFDEFNRIFNRDTILFLEDISEAIYAVERMVRRLILSGAIARVKGIVFGHFTDYRPSANFPDMESMLSSLLAEAGVTGIPVAFDFPAGHTADNVPLVIGAPTMLSVESEGVLLTQSAEEKN